MLAGDIPVGEGQHPSIDSAPVLDDSGSARLAARLRARAHRLALIASDLACRAPLAPRGSTATSVFGIRFASPIGVAAGFDSFGRIGRRFGRLGFGFAEIGTVCMRGAVGRPSLSQAVVAAGRPGPAKLGIVIGPDDGGPSVQAMNGVAECLEALAPLADYVSLSLCGKGGSLRWPLHECIALMRRTAQGVRSVPLLFKVPSGPHLGDLAEAAKSQGYDGIVVEGADATLIAHLHLLMPVVVVGGIHRRRDVRGRLDAGASLVQCCRALMWSGPLGAIALCRQ